MENFTNFNGKARLFAKTINGVNGVFDVYNVGVSKKNEDGSYVNASLDVILSAKAKEDIKNVKPYAGKNCKYYDVVIKGWLTVKKDKNGKNFVAVFVSEIA